MGDILCIWCGHHDPDPSPEHIFPAALGCPDCLTAGEVCTACNNGLGHLDQAIVDDLDVMAFTQGVPRRGGKPALLANRRNVRGEVKEGKPTLFINAERHSVDIGDGRTLPGYRGTGRDIQVDFAVNPVSGKPEVKLSAPIATSMKFVRGLHQIAFSCLAYYRGHEVCRSARYNEVRNFVRAKHRHGRKTLRRRALMLAGDAGPFRLQSWLPVGPEEDLREVVPIKLGTPEFLVDLSPGQVHLPRLVAECERQLGQKGWGLAPPADPHSASTM